MEREIRVVAIDLADGEAWTFFPEDEIYALRKQLSLADLQRAVAEMTVHARMLNPVPAPRHVVSSNHCRLPA